MPFVQTGEELADRSAAILKLGVGWPGRPLGRDRVGSSLYIAIRASQAKNTNCAMCRFNLFLKALRCG